MRRGGVLILLIGLILIVGAVAALLFLQPGLIPGLGLAPEPTLQPEPTPVPEVDLVRARVDLPSGTVISDTVTVLEVVSVLQTEFDSERNFSSLNEVEGLLTTRPFRANEPLVRSALTEPGLSQQIPPLEANRPRDKAYPMVVDSLSGVADQIKPGDFVDIIATFNVVRPVVNIIPGQPSGDPNVADTPPQPSLSEQSFSVAKTIVQQVQVLKILRPAVDPAATPAEGEASEPQVDEQGRVIEGPTPIPGSTLPQGQWALVVAVNDQEVELIEFAVAAQARIVMVLRGAGDTAYEPTLGVTLDLLVSEFGMPLPRPLPPRVIGSDELLTPEPTRTPAPTRIP